MNPGTEASLNCLLRWWCLAHGATSETIRERMQALDVTDIAKALKWAMPSSMPSSGEGTALSALRHVVRNCSCQPSGQRCDICLPAVLALRRNRAVIIHERAVAEAAKDAALRHHGTNPGTG